MAGFLFMQGYAPVKKQQFRIKPRNPEQGLALVHLLNDDKKLVILKGPAGTGKTLLAIAAGLQKVQDGVYDRVLISRPVIPLEGEDVGFLPGTVEEKLLPWLSPIYDNIEVLGVEHEALIRDGFLKAEALAFIRGRSINNQYMIIDEAQNLSPLAVKTILTRAGEGTKVVLTGDPDQIDVPGLNKEDNGLSVAAACFQEQPIAAVHELTQCERSELAALAAQLL